MLKFLNGYGSDGNSVIISFNSNKAISLNKNGNIQLHKTVLGTATFENISVTTKLTAAVAKIGSFESPYAWSDGKNWIPIPLLQIDQTLKVNGDTNLQNVSVYGDLNLTGNLNNIPVANFVTNQTLNSALGGLSIPNLVTTETLNSRFASSVFNTLTVTGNTLLWNNLNLAANKIINASNIRANMPAGLAIYHSAGIDSLVSSFNNDGVSLDGNVSVNGKILPLDGVETSGAIKTKDFGTIMSAGPLTALSEFNCAGRSYFKDTVTISALSYCSENIVSDKGIFAKNLQIEGEARIKAVGQFARTVLDGPLLITGASTTFIASPCNIQNIKASQIYSTSSIPYDDSVFLHQNVINNPNRIEFEETDVVFRKNKRIQGSIFVGNSGSIKFMNGTSQTGQPWFIILNQAIESAMPDVTGLTSSITLINSQI